jgi:DTW domain-containing protein YfiP
MAISVYPFPDNPATTDYCVFPSELEEEEMVLFHATAEENCQAIMADGFKIPDPTGLNGLQTVSFAKRSNLALTHAMMRRASQPGAYCILAVRYETLSRKGLAVNSADIHDSTLDPAPEIIGYCIVPESYRHV